MSYEGFEDFLCKNGHLDSFDCYDAPSPSEFKCRFCGEGYLARNTVDQTNGFVEGSDWPNHRVKLEKKIEHDKCECCGRADHVEYIYTTDGIEGEYYNG
jgi:hypothetical protein